MKLFIRELVIWPDDPNLEPRVIPFEADRISVISGWSGTGKSSVISIIDYVLGASSSTIPVGIIRNAASWYGLLIETDVGPMRLARAKPSWREVSDDFWLQQGEDVNQPLPRRPRSNARTSRIKQLFDDLSQLSNLDADPDGSDVLGRASFRDMAAFNFLPQHIVANPYTLFFKADTSVYREKLRSVLPLALGIITNEDLVRLHTLRLVRDELRHVDAELRIRNEALERWRASATGAFFRAQELGLLPAGPLPESLPEIVDILRRVVEAGGQTVPSAGRVSAAVLRLEGLRKDEHDLDRAIADRRRRLRRLRSLRGSVSDYDEVLGDQQQRARGVGWFREHIVADECVLCGSDTAPARRALEELEGPLAELEELAAGASSATPIVDREIVEIERELLRAEQSVGVVRRTRIVAEEAVDREQGRTQSLEGVYRFIGSTEQALQMLGEVEGEGGLLKRAQSLREKVANIERSLDLEKRREREREIHTAITRGIKRFIEVLGIDGAQGLPSLDPKELNVKFQREGTSRPDFLFEIGSGENWMAYHLATMFALHAIFLRRAAHNPVPTFLVIDQPSQVYFPSDTYDEFVTRGEDAADIEEVHSDGRRLHDLERTRQIFAAIAHVHRSFNGSLQIIVLDHADRNAWGDEDNIVGVQTWRGDSDWLIPRDWISGAAPDAGKP